MSEALYKTTGEAASAAGSEATGTAEAAGPTDSESDDDAIDAEFEVKS